MSSFALFCSCQQGAYKSAQGQQGLQGQLYWIEGNRMPGPGMGAGNPGTPVQRKVHIYPALKASMVTGQAPLYETVSVDPVVVLTSNESGSFFVILEPGTYSVLTEEPNGLFANIIDGDQIINPVEVVEGAFTGINIEINYKAYY